MIQKLSKHYVLDNWPVIDQTLKFINKDHMGGIAHSRKYEPTHNEPRRDWKKLRLSEGDWNNSMEQMFISGSSYGWKKIFYKKNPKLYNSIL